MKNRKLLLIVSLALALTMSLGGTLAYLTDTDSDVNVMTLGNVQIEQNEWQRAEGVGHTNTEETSAKEGDLVPFKQNDPIYPAVAKTDDATQAEKTDLFYWGFYAPGGNGLWNEKELANMRDKIVMVTNTGKTDAYFRTIIAVESPVGFNADLIKLNVNLGWYTSNRVGNTTIDGVQYYLFEYTYKGNTGAGDGVLPAGETARPSLLQVYLDGAATNEDMAKLGDTWEILVVSQAVQAAGFDDAKTALDEAFGEVSATSHPWIDMDDPTDPKDQEPDGVVIPTYAATDAELNAALENGGNVVIDGEIDNEIVYTYSNNNTREIYLNSASGEITLSGGNLILDENATYGLYPYAKGNPITIKDMQIESNAKFGLVAWPSTASDVVTIENVDVNAAGGVGIYAYGPGKTIINNCSVGQSGLEYEETPWADTAIAAATNAVLEINGGEYKGANCVLWVYNSGATVTINDGTFNGAIKVDAGSVTIKGGTFTVDPSEYVPEGYNVTDNGDGTWSVVTAE